MCPGAADLSAALVVLTAKRSESEIGIVGKGSESGRIQSHKMLIGFVIDSVSDIATRMLSSRRAAGMASEEAARPKGSHRTEVRSDHRTLLQQCKRSTPTTHLNNLVPFAQLFIRASQERVKLMY
jgi:hypothetical protein